MDGRTEGQTNRYIETKKERKKERKTDGWMDGRTYVELFDPTAMATIRECL